MENDLIRRSAVIDAIRGEREYLIARKQLNAEHILAHHFDAIMDDIPAVDAVEVRHGRWIDETFKPWGLVYHPYKCDQCGDHSEAPSDYCPHCGARMDGRREDGDA